MFLFFCRWLEHVKQVVNANNLDGSETVSWAAHHANLQLQNVASHNCVTISSLLPLFYEQAKSMAMIRHSVDVIKKAVHILNPTQVPIITVDQPLYSIAKQIHWSWPVSHAEDNFIVMFGGLLIEMAALNILGDLLDGSGWIRALLQAEGATPETAGSLLKASLVTRTRRAYQITACRLYTLLQRIYSERVRMAYHWKTGGLVDSSHVQFWSIILQLELLVMIYLQSTRKADFQLYVHALTKIAPWFFALDHTNYAGWIPIHLRNLVSLQKTHPEGHSEFLKGNFVLNKTTLRVLCNPH